MIRSILVGLDGSKPAESAARASAGMARRLGARLRAVFVDDSAERARMTALPITPGAPVGGAVPPAVLISLQDLEEETARRRDETAAFVAGLAKETGLTDLALETVRGRPADSIVRLGHQVDLLALGRAGLSSDPGEKKLGSTTQAVLHQANKPVLVLSTHEVDARVLVAYDGRHPANNALAAACTLVNQAAGAPAHQPLELLVLTVAETERQAQPILEEARQYLLPHQVQARLLWRSGTVSDAIVAQMTEAGGGLVAMGAFGQSRLREVFLGSHTRRVLLACEYPVLLTR
jgi:nucleotide-binding universal stress UspA family protein